MKEAAFQNEANVSLYVRVCVCVMMRVRVNGAEEGVSFSVFKSEKIWTKAERGKKS